MITGTRMTKKRKTRTVKVGNVKLGGRYDIVIQSMTKVATTDVPACLAQIKRLAKAGAPLVRVAVPTPADTRALAKLVDKSPVPLIADIHFSPARAIEALQAGAAKIRLNPGNIRNRTDIIRIADAVKAHGAAVRIGVNEASIRDLRKPDVPPARRVRLMLARMKSYVRLFEKRRVDQLVLSAKSSSTLRTIEVNRMLAETFDYPIHLGLTHAGLPEDASIPSAVAIGTLLAEGIGDTIRVSAAGDPVSEVRIAEQILQALGLRQRHGPELIVCPTCARAQMDVVQLARRVRKLLGKIDTPLRVAVMGCVVNGPGEAADADLALCTAKTRVHLYRCGKKIAVLDNREIITELKKQLQTFIT